jgi:hypothetical protein
VYTVARRGLALAGAIAVAVGMAVASAPAVVASAPHAAAKPSSVSLTTSDATYKSSTKQALHVSLEASNNPSTPANDALVVTLSKGTPVLGETHTWTFQISSNVLKVATAGSGTLKVPATSIAPFGSVDLKIKPVGKIASQSCGGQVISQSVKVAVSGVFFFDSKSTGANKWGSVGRKKAFTFPASNVVTWLYSTTTSESCLPDTSVCQTGLLWTAQQSGAQFEGVSTNAGGSIFASRGVALSRPQGAIRTDSSTGTTFTPTVSTAANGDGTLTVNGSGGVTGSGVLQSSGQAQEISVPCAGGSSQKTDFWTGTFNNGATALSVPEQIYGPITVQSGATGTFTEPAP